jgi:rhodanese-related sulfurtransferase
LKSKLDSGAAITILDSRPFDEFHDESIPGAVNLPLAEQPYRIADIVTNPEHEIVVNCGGRARAVLGCQSLINAGVPNPISALYYGTMGWDLAGYTLARGAEQASIPLSSEARAWARQAAGQIVHRFAVRSISWQQLQAWRAESQERTVYVIDVRGRAEFDAGHLPDCAWVPGGELIGLTEDHIATRNARLCLVDNDGARATLIASWMMQMGWPDVAVLDEGIDGYPGTDLGLESTAPVAAAPGDAADGPIEPDTAARMAARHAGFRQTMEARERLPDQLGRDGTLGFRLPPPRG